MVLDIVKCRICGCAVVIEVGKKPICRECVVKKNRAYQDIRSMLRDFPEQRFCVDDVSKALNIDEKLINYLLEEGMFQLVRGFVLK